MIRSVPGDHAIRRIFALAAVLAATLCMLSVPAAAESQAVYVRNNTGEWAWVTAIGWVKNWGGFGSRLENLAAWCVPPRSYDRKENFSTTVESVRFEMTTGTNCAHPRVSDQTYNNIPRGYAAEFTITVHECKDMRTLKPYPCYRASGVVADINPKPSICQFTCQSWLEPAGRCIGSSSNACGAPPRDYLPPGGTLTQDQTLVSPDRRYYALQQRDGNLCVFKNAPGDRAPQALWCHNGTGRGGQFVLIMQGDGNLCTYYASNTRSNPRWCSMRTAQGGQFFVVQQNDGNLCVYPGTSPQDRRGNAIWCHNQNVGK
jgi:hypothetical protein